MKVVMLFPGYGSQYVGMGKELYDNNRIVQEYFEEASQCLGTNFVKQIFASSESDLAQMSNAYTCQFVTSSSIYALLKQEGITSDTIAGYNLGAFSALCAAKGISFPDGLYLLTKYAQFYQEALDNLPSMALMKISNVDTRIVERECAQERSDGNFVTVGFFISPSECIISGTRDLVEMLGHRLSLDHDAIVEEVPLEVGLHSSLLDPMMVQFKMNLVKVDCKDLAISVIDTITAETISDADQVKEYIINLVNKPINWWHTVKQCESADVLVEVGPGTALATMLAQQFPDKKIVSINTRADIEELKKLIAK